LKKEGYKYNIPRKWLKANGLISFRSTSEKWVLKNQNDGWYYNDLRILKALLGFFKQGPFLARSAIAGVFIDLK
jgi:hypothetical protein